MSLEQYLLMSEGKSLEFKENFLPKKNILHTCIAFANTAGGTLIVGIRDKDRSPVGIEEPHVLAESIANFIYDSVEPKLLPNIEVLEWQGRYFVKIEIYPSPLRPHHEKNKIKSEATYIRIGSTTRLADESLIKSIEREISLKPFDETICYETNYEELDFRAASELFSKQRALTESDLLTLNLALENQGKISPTVGGVILFGKERLKYFPDAYIKAGYFEGEDKTNILSTKDISSYFPSALGEALYFIQSSLGVSLKIENLQHQEIWKIPKVAIREALVNAIVHNDYSLRGCPIHIAVFSNRLEIENNGCLPWGLSIEDMKKGVSKLRNPVLGRVFFELGLIERWGSGIKRMITACEDVGLSPPLFEEIGARIRVTFFYEKRKISTFDEIDTKIKNSIASGKNTTHTISQSIGLSKRATRSRLLRLVELGTIVEVSKNPRDPGKTYHLFDVMP